MDVKVIGKNIKRLRKDAGLTQEDLAEKAKIANRALQRLEAGNGNPTVETLSAIARAVGTPVIELFDLSIPAEYLDESALAGLKQLSKAKRNREAAQEPANTGRKILKHGVPRTNPDVSAGLELLSTYSSLPPDLQKIALTVLYQDSSYLEEIPLETRKKLALAVGALFRSLQKSPQK